VNLGCGYDPLPFEYLATVTDTIFVDVDYPDLIQHKCTIIRDTPALQESVGSTFEETSGEIRSNKYYAIGCDLSNLTVFEEVLLTIDASIRNTNILFISEVAIAYMVP
jgi:tRNA wybutosine-synthesizing protein 4